MQSNLSSLHAGYLRKERIIKETHSMIRKKKTHKDKKEQKIIAEERMESTGDKEETKQEKTVEPTDNGTAVKVEVKEAEPPEESSAEDKLAVLNDKYLRLLAEYDNFRKRTEREKSDLIKTASEELLRELLPILDSLDRATEHKNDKTTFDEYVKGIAIIEDQFRAVLAKVGLEAIEAVGQPFDPMIHDAVMQVETEEYESGVVSAEMEKGYVLSGKVIRHPKVIVSK